MKIAFLLTQSLESPSGLGRYKPLAEELARLGYTIEIYALHPDIDSLANSWLYQNNVAVHYVAPMHVRKQGNEKSYYSAGKLITLTLQATSTDSRISVKNCSRHSSSPLVRFGSLQKMVWATKTPILIPRRSIAEAIVS